MDKLTLYTRKDCGLCEQAEALLVANALDFTKADINSRADWLEKYITTIPVIAANGREVGWPFTAEDAIKLAAAGAEQNF